MTTYKGALSELVNGASMFRICGKLASFDEDLPKLQNGDAMFYNSNLPHFGGTLPSLTNGDYMFIGCKLDLPSVQTIARTIKDNSDMATPPPLGLGMSKDIKGQVDGELDLIRSKGWALMTVWY